MGGAGKMLEAHLVSTLDEKMDLLGFVKVCKCGAILGL